MSRSNRLMALGVVAVVAGVFLSLVGLSDGNVPAAKAATPSTSERYAVQATAADGSAYDYIPVGNRGWSATERKNNRLSVTIPLYALATGEVIGTINNQTQPNGPGTTDVISSFVFPDGTLVSRVTVSFAQDPAKPGWIIFNARPDEDSIIEATGVFAGRTGRVELSGTNDLTRFPAEIYQDIFWVIKLNK